MTSPPAVEVRQRKLTSNDFDYDPSFLANTPDPNTSFKQQQPEEKYEQETLQKSKAKIKTTSTSEAAPKPDRLITLAFTIFGILTRYFRISTGKYVLWDEAHFGKFGSHYLKRTFYFDVHPPLGKMLVGLAGWLAGYDGSFEFNSGSDYPSTVNYVGMRMFLALFSALAVPFAYLTAVQLKLNKPASILVGLMTLLDVGFIGIGRLILLDSMLIFFTTATTFYYCLFRNQKPFTIKWWISLLLTGVCIGSVSSVKWVGFLATALIGLLTIEELWNMLESETKVNFVKHFGARTFGLIFIPVSIYLGSFYVHFTILNHSGPGDANMSSLFQAGLKGNELSKSPLNVAYGSLVTIKSRSHGGGLLHSHVQTYPLGSKQQQVTTYHHKDLNNDWFLVPQNKTTDSDELQFVKNDDILKIKHKTTNRFLHSHFVEAPVTKGDLEVSGYGNDEYQDPNDLWQVEIVSDAHPEASSKKQLRSLSTNFRLKHMHTGCYLRSRNLHLPEWGFKQGEVSCERNLLNPNKRDILWNIESQVNEKLPTGEPGQYKSRFLDDVWDCNVGMWMTNNALTPNPELEPSILTSRASDWLFMRKGIRMSGWDDARTKFYMLGTPAVWLTSSLSIIFALGLIGVMILLAKRHVITLSTPGTDRFFYQSKVAIGGWALHYLPFFLIGRVLYLHHYYPALTFAILCFGQLFDYVTSTLSPRKRWGAFITVSGVVFGNFIYFSPLCYGMDGPAKNFLGRKWINSWNL